MGKQEENVEKIAFAPKSHASISSIYLPSPHTNHPSPIVLTKSEWSASKALAKLSSKSMQFHASFQIEVNLALSFASGLREFCSVTC